MSNKFKILSGVLVIVVCTLIGVLRLKDNPQKKEVSVEPVQYMEEMSIELEPKQVMMESVDLTQESAVSEEDITRNVVPKGEGISKSTVPKVDGKVENNPESEQKLLVHVCGQVNNPGVYTLNSGDRIIDAVNMAGGFTEDASTDYLNLASSLVDGCKVYVPSLQELEVSEQPVGVSCDNGVEMPSLKEGMDLFEDVRSAASGKVNINTASKEELMTLNGVGESKAVKIITYREENGGFRTINDIMNIPGIKEGMFNKIKDMITV